MLKSLINKIGTLLKLVFSWSRVQSRNSKTKAKKNQGHAGSTSGDNSPLHIGNVHNYHAKKEIRETTSYRKSWKHLLKAFSPESAQRLARLINDPKSKDPRKHNLEGHRNWLSKQFKNIGLDHSDPRATEFNLIREEAIISIEELYDDVVQSQFEKNWANYLLRLEAIEDI